jgi:hypothetical protein
MRFRLRTLLIVLAVGPMVLAMSFEALKEWQRRKAEEKAWESLDRWYEAHPPFQWQNSGVTDDRQTISPLP